MIESFYYNNLNSFMDNEKKTNNQACADNIKILMITTQQEILMKTKKLKIKQHEQVEQEDKQQ